jgi:hypothetical protein
MERAHAESCDTYPNGFHAMEKMVCVDVDGFFGRARCLFAAVIVPMRETKIAAKRHKMHKKTPSHPVRVQTILVGVVANDAGERCE